MKKMTFLACAAMLTSAIALNSCKSDAPVDPNLTDGDVVKTEFAISLPDNAVGGPKKMKSGTVQDDGINDFNGITGIILVPFANADSIQGAYTRIGNNIALTAGVSKSDIEDKASKAKVFSNVSIPLTTASFLFYGVSAAGGNKFQVGSLLPDTANAGKTTASQYSFAPEPICATFSSSYMSAGKGSALMSYLTSIACASDGAKLWYQYGTGGDSLAIHNMFETYSKMHGLSSFEVARVLTDLYQSLMPISSTISTGIKNAIQAGTTYVDVNTTTGVVTMKSGYDNFPLEYGIPAGAVDMKWDADSHSFVEGVYSNMAAPAKYVYPANLWYYANSTIVTSKSSKKTMYDGSTSWSDILDAHEDGNSVNTLTRAVALNDSIQYAVARLDVQVRLKDTAKLADNSLIVEGVKTDVDYGTGFPVTGILIGGQKGVGYNFKPVSGDDYYTIYDTVMNDAAMKAAKAVGTAGYSNPNHTLVLETAKNADIRIAVEMLNNTEVDFYGAGGQLIPKGGKFYVVAEFEADDAAKTGQQVFKQDYITTAKLTLNNLKKAYNTIPDLRTPKLEIGFSVDLNWKSGHTYEIDFE